MQAIEFTKKPGKTFSEEEREEGAYWLSQLLKGKCSLVLTGAGLSTDSGIPDYRGNGTARRARTPMRFLDFAGSAAGRQRYWARATLGWPKMRDAQPNAGHEVLSQLRASGHVSGVITQNVDGLHQKAGTDSPIELHGALRQVVCLDCGLLHEREEIHQELLRLNPGWLKHKAEFAPDGDALLRDQLSESFRVTECSCGGTLKPHVVYFGENIPSARVKNAFYALSQADALLVVGSSLTVFSGYRFIRQAIKEQKPVYLINRGPTRADEQATVKIEACASSTLQALSKALAV